MNIPKLHCRRFQAWNTSAHGQANKHGKNMEANRAWAEAVSQAEVAQP